jgi:L-rhamnose isomerase
VELRQDHRPLRDRSYRLAVGTLRAIELAAASGELAALDLNYPFDEEVSVADVHKSLVSNGHSVTNISPVIYNRRFRSGSFTAAGPALRRAAAELADEPVEVAATLDARSMKFWPVHDGYDYPLQVDFQGQLSSNLTGLSAGVIIAIAPILLLYACLQLFIVGGFSGALKG